ncbi:MAG TPA: UDP-glucose 4-epimerase GalE [Bdellovibrionales bacterium]|nr:UDP-glucose 4-epimerase GalE [Bdellovibrionales bacterium]
MKLLVTGGAGYIGSHAAYQLVEAGHQVTVIDTLDSGHRWAVPPEAEFIEGSIGDVALLDSVFSKNSFAAVLHFAAHIEVEESVSSPAKYFKNNTCNTVNLFDACLRHGVGKVIFSSTAAVYGEPTQSLVPENAALAPVNPYGWTKLMSERVLQELAAPSKDLRYVILRYFNVAGARLDGKIGQTGKKSTHLIKIAAEAAAGKRTQMSINGNDYETADGTCLRDYVHVEDLASAHLAALDYLDRGGKSDIFNVGYGKPYSVREVISVMKEASGVDFKVVEGPRRAGDPASLAADVAKIRGAFNWSPKYQDLNLICKTAFNWEKELIKRGFTRK